MTELPLELKKTVVKAHNAYEKDWKYHLKVCEHDCKDTEKQKDLFGVGYSAGQTRTEGVFASFLETTRKKLKEKANSPEVCNCGLGAHIEWEKDEDGYVSIEDIDAVFGGERKKEEGLK